MLIFIQVIIFKKLMNAPYSRSTPYQKKNKYIQHLKTAWITQQDGQL